jgi:methylene-fatty-acyl-phospholipid synthase
MFRRAGTSSPARHIFPRRPAPVNLWAFLVAAALLSVERLTYAAIWRAPEAFRRLCDRLSDHSVEAVDVLAVLFVAFKVIQVAAFAGWCLAHGGSVFPVSSSPAVLASGLGLVVAGQLLNLSVFAGLGKIGVFYGNRLGHQVSWRNGFPFSWFRHPQYVGAVLSIWGFFIALRYPAPDWLAVPLLETVYYLAGARLERHD